MGARGKKRRRKDGSVADGRLKQPAIAPLQIMETEADPVPPELLERSLTIRNRHRPFDPLAQAKMTDEELFEADEAEGREIHELANDDAIETALIIRGLNLEAYLERPENRYLYSIAEDGTVTTDETLLRYAATIPMTDHPDDALQWPAES